MDICVDTGSCRPAAGSCLDRACRPQDHGAPCHRRQNDAETGGRTGGGRDGGTVENGDEEISAGDATWTGRRAAEKLAGC